MHKINKLMFCIHNACYKIINDILCNMNVSAFGSVRLIAAQRSAPPSIQNISALFVPVFINATVLTQLFNIPFCN